MTHGTPDASASGVRFLHREKTLDFLKKGVDKWGSGVYNTTRR